MSLLAMVFFALPFSGWLGATRATASNRPAACTPAPAYVVGSQRPTATGFGTVDTVFVHSNISEVN